MGDRHRGNHGSIRVLRRTPFRSAVTMDMAEIKQNRIRHLPHVVYWVYAYGFR
jgi:hypothetical protein